ncbi:MAG: chemotaxis protein CheW [Phenylobacterium sp.]|nr:chemotaxis protein CheW [Phenylobacterium sp.]
MSTPDRPERSELLTFQLDTEIVAVEAVRVREVLDKAPVSEVPGARPFVPGVLNVRGQVVPLADLRLKLNLSIRPPTPDSRIVVLETTIGGEPVTVGVRADRVFEVTELEPGSLEEAPAIGLRWRKEHVRFIGKRGEDLIIALDIDRIFSDEEAQVPVGTASAATFQDQQAPSSERAGA